MPYCTDCSAICVATGKTTVQYRFLRGKKAFYIRDKTKVWQKYPRKNEEEARVPKVPQEAPLVSSTRSVYGGQSLTFTFRS